MTRKTGGWRRQFAEPSGWLGRLAGHLMVAANAGLNQMAVDALEVGPAERVLEIGCGPGLALERIAARAKEGFAAGIDPSPVMLRQAEKRNREAVLAGRVELRSGTVSGIPYGDGSFDKVCTINTVYLWPDREAAVREMRRVLRPGGRLVVAFRGRGASAETATGLSALSDGEIADLMALLSRTGFTREEKRSQPGRRGEDVCVVAHL